jgi:hypothetical protein
MNRKAYASRLALICLTLTFLALAFLASCSSSSNSTTTTPPVVAITATSGGGQSAAVSAAFGAPLVATVTSGGSPASGVTVTFTAPASGASGTFATPTPGATDTETTNASGVATSQAFTANTTSGGYTVTASATGAVTPASFSLTNTAGAAANLAATSGGGQSATVSTAFANPLVATVTDGDGNPVQGVTVTFTAPGSGPSGLFADGGTAAATDPETTGANGEATSTVFTANATAGGPYNVVATSGALTPVNFALTNTAVVVVSSNNYAFYVSGQDVGFEDNGPNYYAIAGSVTIDTNGKVLGGEQDYNDGYGITSPTGGDTIMPETGALVVNPTTGQGTLTLTTNNANVGVNGVETFAIQFVNGKHALLTQFDGSATSSGSLDFQTLSSTLTDGNYAFTLSGVDPGYYSIVYGGVFTISNTGTSLAGTYDVDDFNAGTAPVLGTPFSGTIGPPDTFGRGTITSTLGIALSYYVVGPEAIRIIDVDPSSPGVSSDAAVGSAFGQGTGTFSNASLGASVFGVQSNTWGLLYDAAGMFATTPGSGTFTGVADDAELEFVIVSGAAISGTYSIASNGYGNLTITPGDLGDVSVLGVYMTDPALNLNDPNNTNPNSAVGGALIADLDGYTLNGTGVLTPQTDTAAPGYEGTYAFGAQNYNVFNPDSVGWELDFVGLGTVTDGALAGTGSVSDPWFTLDGGNGSATLAATFADSAVPDPSNHGRYTVSTLAATLSGAGTQDFSVVIYQASGTQLYWIEEDDAGDFLGTFEQQGSLTGMPAVRKPVANPQLKQK